MNEHEIVLSVIDDTGIAQWLDRVTADHTRQERVGKADLTRVLRLLEATTAHVVLVELSDHDLDQSLAIMTALTSSRPWVTVIAVCNSANQERLLHAMRAGARDCFVAGSDVGDVRERLQRHLLVRQGHYGDDQPSPISNLTLVAAAHPTVDTRFLTQNLALAYNRQHPEQRCLAIDTQPSGHGVFYLEANNEYTLENLLAMPEALDEALIATALEEVRPGLRMLCAGLDASALQGDRGADLFIALSHLTAMFDRIFINVGTLADRHWVRALGVHARQLLIAMHPQVDQAHAVRTMGSEWRTHLAKQSDASLIIDGREGRVPPSDDELADTTGLPITGHLPMDWPHRLLSQNSGEPIQEQSPRCSYARALEQLAKHVEGDSQPIDNPGLFDKLKAQFN